MWFFKFAMSVSEEMGECLEGNKLTLPALTEILTGWGYPLETSDLLVKLNDWSYTKSGVPGASSYREQYALFYKGEQIINAIRSPFDSRTCIRVLNNKVWNQFIDMIYSAHRAYCVRIER